MEENRSELSNRKLKPGQPDNSHHMSGNVGQGRRYVNVASVKRDRRTEILEKCEGIEEILNMIKKDGSVLWKIRSGSKRFRRKFSINLEKMKLEYTPSAKSGSCWSGSAPQIDIAEISEIRKGWKTDVFNKIEIKQEKISKISTTARPGRTFKEECCFSIIYGDRNAKTLDLVAPNSDIADKWVFAIESLLNWYERKLYEEGYELWLKEKINLADTDNDKCLTYDETLKLLNGLNIELSESEAQKLFTEANTNLGTGRERKVLNEDELMVLYFKLLKRPEIEKLFDSYASRSGVFTAKELSTFLQNEQSGYENIPQEATNVLIQNFEHSDLKKQGLMTTSGFVSMLLSSEFDIFNYREHGCICQDMTLPLSHYYIASSHNTYIQGNQLIGKNSCEAYVDALKRGCKCVELDCYDGEDDEPVVWHGYTLTTKISFREVLEDAIKPYAFVVSPYPLILSLEVHCSPLIRLKMASYLRAILADMLYTTVVSDDMENLPSPEELQGKILIKAKNVNDTKGKTKSERISNSSTKNYYNQSNGVYSQTNTVNMYRESSTRTTSYTDSVDARKVMSVGKPTIPKNLRDGVESDQSDNDDVFESSPRDALSALVNLVQPVKFESFKKSRLNDKCFQMSSFSESHSLKLIEESPVDFIDYNKRQISRIYPAASRMSSSNFSPVQFWSVGCQLVALNYQTRDIPNLINDAMFKQNGFCGYVLKPADLRDAIRFDPRDLSQKIPIHLKIRIISGQHLPKADGNSEIVDPYVELTIIGIPESTAENILTTKKVHTNGFNPIWDETFEITVRYPDLTFLCFCVRDYERNSPDMPIGYYVIPFNAMTTGYRHVRLQGIGGELLSPATLFVHIDY